MPNFNTTTSERTAARKATLSLPLSLNRAVSSNRIIGPVGEARKTFASPTIAEQLQNVKKRSPIKHPDTLGAIGRQSTKQAVVEIEYEDPTLIDRRTSKRMPYWDIIMILSLLFAATVTPYEVTYLTEGPCVTPLFIVNRACPPIIISPPARLGFPGPCIWVAPRLPWRLPPAPPARAHTSCARTSCACMHLVRMHLLRCVLAPPKGVVSPRRIPSS